MIVGLKKWLREERISHLYKKMLFSLMVSNYTNEPEDVNSRLKLFARWEKNTTS